jgi:ketosteroid isomerase-like protein
MNNPAPSPSCPADYRIGFPRPMCFLLLTRFSSSSMNANQKVVESYLAAFRRLDLDGLMRHFAEHGVYLNLLPGPFASPLGGVHGRDHIRQVFQPVLGALVRNDYINARTYTTPDDDELVLVENTCDMEFPNGTVYRGFVLYRFEVVDGKIQKLTELVTDPQQQLAAWQLGQPGFELRG